MNEMNKANERTANVEEDEDMENPNLNVSVMQLQPSLFEAWARKQGGSIKNWKKRWCLIFRKRLWYFKSKNSSYAQGCILLDANAKVQKESSMDVPGKRYFFSIDSRNQKGTRKFMFCVEYEPYLNEFVRVLKSVIDSQKGIVESPVRESSAVSVAEVELTPMQETVQQQNIYQPAIQQPYTYQQPGTYAQQPMINIYGQSVQGNENMKQNTEQGQYNQFNQNYNMQNKVNEQEEKDRIEQEIQRQMEEQRREREILQQKEEIRKQQQLEEEIRKQQQLEEEMRKQQQEAERLRQEEIRKREQEEIFRQQQEQEEMLRQQEILRQQQEQQEILRQQQEQEELLRQQQEQQELLRKQQEQEELLRKQQEQEELLRQQQEQQELLRQQQEQEELLRQQEMEKIKQQEVVFEEDSDEMSSSTSDLGEGEELTLQNIASFVQAFDWIDENAQEFVQLFYENIPRASPTHVSASVNPCGTELFIRCSSPVSEIDALINFFTEVGSPEDQIQILVNESKKGGVVAIESWISLSDRGGCDAGWDIIAEQDSLNVIETISEKSEIDYVGIIKLWCVTNHVNFVHRFGRDMGDQPPYNTEFWMDIPNKDISTIQGAAKAFMFPEIPPKILEECKKGRVMVRVVTSEEGFIKFSIFIEKIKNESISDCITSLNEEPMNVMNLEQLLNIRIEAFEYTFMNEGFGYEVYDEGPKTSVVFRMGSF